MKGAIHTTKKELSQLYWLNKEIAREKQRLEELECAARGGTAKLSGMPHVDGTTRAQEQYAVLIAEQRDLVELKVRQLVIEYNRLNRYIASVDDSLIRQILSLRYVDGMSWLQVAIKVGGGNTADSVKKQCYRFLAKKETCPECPE